MLAAVAVVLIATGSVGDYSSGGKLIEFLTFAPAQTAQAGPRFQVAAAAIPPTIDGRLDDPCWQTAGLTDALTVAKSLDKPAHRTVVRVCFDRDALYVAFEAFDARPDLIRQAETERDGKVWRDDCVEVFLDPTRNGRDAFQIEVSAGGTVWDGHHVLRPNGEVETDRGWNADLETAAAVNAGGYVVELKIPTAALGIDAVMPGALWGANFTRITPRSGEYASWAPWRASYGRGNNARHYGALLLGRAAVMLGEVDLGSRAAGRNRLEATVSTDDPAAAEQTDLVFQTVTSGREQTVTAPIRWGGRKEVVLPLVYELPNAPAQVQAELLLRSRDTTYARCRYTVDVRGPRLAVRCATPHVTRGGKPLIADITLWLGNEDLKTAELEVEVRPGPDAAGQALSERIKLECSGEARLGLNLGRLPEGRYALAVRLLDGAGNSLEKKSIPVSVVEDLFGGW